MIAELKLTNLDKVFWEEEGITKGDLIEYYRTIHKLILPYLIDRPQSLRRYPNGIHGEAFFQKNVTKLPKWMPSVSIDHENKTVHYLMIEDENSLLYTINLGCIDLNPFSSRIQNLHNPDYLVFDLDPEDISFDKVVETALAIHDVLDQIEAPNYVKTTGSRGMHIYVPAAAAYTYEQVKQFANIIAEIVHNKLPKITSLVRSPSKRQKRVYIDYLQNNFGQTLVAPYSVRAKPRAPVSTPLEWHEVKFGLDPHDFNLKTILKRIKKTKDLFSPVLGKGINLQKCLKKLEKIS